MNPKADLKVRCYISMAIIALDARLTGQMSVGMKAYVTELAARLPLLAPEFEFMVFGNEPLPLPNNATFYWVPRACAVNGGLGEQLLYAGFLARAKPNLVHFMSIYAPRRSSLAHVYTIHDLIHLRFPQYFSWKVPPYYRWVVGPAARSARFVITDARATLADLRTYLQVEPDRVRVVPLGVGEAFTLNEQARTMHAEAAKRRFGLDRSYFVYAGNHRPHKNIQTLVEAWRMTKAPSDLVLTEDGPFDFVLDAGQKTNGRIVCVGHVTQGELISLYAGCSGAVQPSLYEGFGLGALEAMSVGAPVIVARTPALLELTEHAAATFLAHDAAGLAKQMDTLAMDASQREALRAAGRKRACDFSWDLTARQTAQVYREALGQ